MLYTTLQGRIEMQNNTFPPTKRQKEFLEMITNFYESNYYMPTYDEIREAMSLKSYSAVTDNLKALERKGFLVRDFRKPRAIKLLRNLDGTTRV